MSPPLNQDDREISDRAALYRVLAQLYRKEISPAFGKLLGESGLLDDLEDRGYEVERAALADPDEIADLKLEYARVFLGPGKHVSPYGSVHHPGDAKRGQLWGDSTCRIQRFARDHDLEFGGQEYDGIPDHIAHELDLFAKLLEGRARALQDGDQDKAERIRNSEQYLYREDLSRWVPAFCRKVCKVTRRPFYAEIARLTMALLDEQAAELEEASA